MSFITDILKKGARSLASKLPTEIRLKLEAVKLSRDSGLRGRSAEHSLFITAIHQENWFVLNYLLDKHGEDKFREKFIENGEYRSAFWKREFTPLAAGIDHPRVVEWLISDMGVDCTKTFQEGTTYLGCISYTQKRSTVEKIGNELKSLKLLIKHGHDLHSIDKSGDNALSEAVKGCWKFRLAEAADEPRYERFGKVWTVDKRCGPARKSKFLEKLGLEKQGHQEAFGLMDYDQWKSKTIARAVMPFGSGLAAMMSPLVENAKQAQALKQLGKETLAEKEWAADNVFEDTFRTLYNCDPEIVKKEHVKRVLQKNRENKSQERS